jgi:hypothetical protein
MSYDPLVRETLMLKDEEIAALCEKIKYRDEYIALLERRVKAAPTVVIPSTVGVSIRGVQWNPLVPELRLDLVRIEK